MRMELLRLLLGRQVPTRGSLVHRRPLRGVQEISSDEQCALGMTAAQASTSRQADHPRIVSELFLW